MKKLNKLLRLVVTLVIFLQTRAEESSILQGASVASDGMCLATTTGQSAQSLIDGSFKTRICGEQTTTAMTITLPTPEILKTIFLLNSAQDEFKRNLGTIRVVVGQIDKLECVGAFYDTGFYQCTAMVAQDVIILERTPPVLVYNEFILNELRVYQTPNIFGKLIVQVSAPPAKSSEFEATNLLNNLTSRSSGNNLHPYASMTTLASHLSCYKTTNVQLALLGNKLEITFNLGASYFQHCVTVVQDLYGGKAHNEHTDMNQYFQNYQVYIGNDPVYSNNPMCAGGPFMRTTDSSSFTIADDADGASLISNAQWWNYGKEIWCNLEGQYTTIVADLTGLVGAYEMSLCNVGIMGTQYVRLGYQLPTSVTYGAGGPRSYDALDTYAIKVAAGLEIGNAITIKMRQKADATLSWVSIYTYTGSSQHFHRITVSLKNTTPVGVHTVILESYDSKSSVQSTLRTDVLQIIIDDCSNAPLTHDLDTSSTITVLREYQPIIYYAKQTMTHPDSNIMNKCWGSSNYQSITSSSRDLEVVDYPSSGLQRIEFETDTPLGSYTVSIRVRFWNPYYYYASETAKQKYLVKTVMSTEYLKQPVLTPDSYAFAIAPGAAGLQTIDGGSIVVKYPFVDNLSTDTLSNSPAAVHPVPYTSFDASRVSLRTASLGSAGYLDDPKGDLLGLIGTIKALQELKFVCKDWILILMETTESFVAEFENTLYADFKTTIPYTCNYEYSAPPEFKTEPIEIKVETGKAQSFELPEIIPGSLPFQELKFIPDDLIVKFVTLVPPADPADPLIYKVDYNGDPSVIDLLGQKDVFPIVMTLVNTFGQETEITLNFSLLCTIRKPDLEEIEGILDPELLELALQTEKVGEEELSYEPVYDKIVQKIKYDEVKRKNCGDITIELFTSKSKELKHDAAKQTLTLISSESTEVMTIEDSYLEVKLMDFTWKIKIKATFFECKLTTLGFSKSREDVEYALGSGAVIKTIPQIKQDPDCGNTFIDFKIREIKSSLAAEKVATAVSFDSVSRELTIDSADMTFANAAAEVVIVIEQDIVENAGSFRFVIKFKSDPPKFEMKEWSVDPLKCTKEDSTWSMQIPAATTEDVSPVEITLSDNTDILVQEGGFVSLVGLLTDTTCPTSDSLDVKFELKSAVLGTNVQTLTIAINKPEKSKDGEETQAFSGVSIADVDQQSATDKKTNTNKQETVKEVEVEEPPEPIKVSRLSMSPQGSLKIQFTKPFLPLPFWVTSNATKSKKLQSTDFSFEDALTVEVEGQDDFEIDKSIGEIIITEITDRSLTIQVLFGDISAISKNIRDPDMLIITLAMPNIFIDAETGEALSTDPIVFKLPVGAQYTPSQFKELTSKAQNAAQISLAVTLWEIIMVFAFKKVLFSMWILILTLQFFVYIYAWQIRFPNTLQFMFYELKRITLGEFMDDLDFGGTVMEAIGMPANEASSTEEIVGEDRLGSSSPLESFGATLLLGSLLFILILFLLILVIVLVKRSNPSPKCRERAKKMKRLVFFNPIIRYLVLNSLKLNMAGFMVFKAQGDTMDKAVGIAILTLVNGAPIIFCISVERWKKTLETEDVRKSFGALYAGKNISPKDHHASLFPMQYFWRRALFVAATIFLFDYPVMQMNAHFLLTMISIGILSTDPSTFDSTGQRIVEVGSEFALHMTSIMLSLFLNPVYDQPEQRDLIEKLTLACLGLLLLLNITFMLWTLITNCKEKSRKKRIEGLRKKQLEQREKKKQESESKRSNKLTLTVIAEESDSENPTNKSQITGINAKTKKWLSKKDKRREKKRQKRQEQPATQEQNEDTIVEAPTQRINDSRPFSRRSLLNEQVKGQIDEVDENKEVDNSLFTLSDQQADHEKESPFADYLDQIHQEIANCSEEEKVSDQSSYFWSDQIEPNEMSVEGFEQKFHEVVTGITGKAEEAAKTQFATDPNMTKN